MGMFGIIGGIALIVCGALCIPGIIAKKSPEAKELLDKIAKFQGIIGIVICIIGIIGVIQALINIGLIGYSPIIWLTWLGSNVLNVLVGFLLGFGMIQQIALSKAPDDAKKKAEELYQKLVGIQIPLGFACLIGGVWTIIAIILFRF
jgi:hypothetical protein